MAQHTIAEVVFLLQHMTSSKNNLRNALQYKGAVIPEDTPIEDYPAIITNLCS